MILAALLLIAISNPGTVTSTAPSKLTVGEVRALKAEIETCFEQKRTGYEELGVCVGDKADLKGRITIQTRQIAELNDALRKRPGASARAADPAPRIRSPPVMGTFGVVLSSALCASGAAALGAAIDENGSRGAALGAGAGALVCGAAVILSLIP